MRVEMHCHTASSPDSFLSLEELEQVAIRRSIDAVAITDHGTIDAALLAQNTWKKLKVIIGEEILTSEGEVIGYFLTEKIPYHLTAAETIRRIHQQGGLVSVDHPFCRLRRHPLSKEALDNNIQNIDFIEVFNARNVFDADNKKAYDYCQAHEILPCVGSDAHTKWELGNAIAVIPEFHDALTFKQAMSGAHFETKRSPIAVHVATKYTKWYKKLTQKNS